MAVIDDPARAPWYERRLVRWLAVALFVGIAIVVAAVIIVRALPKSGEAQVEIAGWRVPVGVVVDTSSRSAAPGLLLNSLLGGDPVIRVDAGEVATVGDGAITIRSYAGSRHVAYRLNDRTRTLDARRPLAQPGPPAEGEAVAVITRPDSDTALVVVTGVERR